jgi:PadR family transcriptional regulator AphA
MGKENKSRYALLGMLSLAPMSGYDIKKATDISINHFWKENYAQIYPMLKQLAKEGLTTSHVEEQEGKPDRHVYTLTDKGREELQRWLAGPVDYQVYRNELLLKLFFGKQIPVPSSIEHVRRYREIHVQLLRVLQETEAYIKDEEKEDPNLPYWLITLSYGKHDAQSSIAWCDETLATLEKLTETE